MDSEALIERRPEVALIDELAHTNIPGSRRAKRWEDVLDVLAQGITVLTTLRELALIRVANRVDETLLARWSKRRSPETRERILVCVSRPDLSEDLIRRGGRIAQRTGGDLSVVHVVAEEGRPDPEWLRRVQRLVEELGGDFQLLEADDPVEGVLSFAYGQHVTQVLVGESLRSRWQELMRGSFVNRLIRRASNIDVHLIARRERREMPLP